MTMLRRFLSHTAASSAAEFALVLPLALTFLLGIIDAGRFAWEFNRAEKATQTGARWAVATDLIASDLGSYSFALQGGIPQGTTVPISSFPGVTCEGSGGSVMCTCATGGSCGFGMTANSTAFNALVNRMAEIEPDITTDHVAVDYKWSGLGYSGDPNGPDVAPLVTVRLKNMTFQPLTLYLFRSNLSMPSFSYTLTMEDGQGTTSN